MSELKRLRDEWHDAQGAQDFSLASDYIDELEKERKQFVERTCDIANNLKVTVGEDGAWLISLYDLKQGLRGEFK